MFRVSCPGLMAPAPAIRGAVPELHGGGGGQLRLFAQCPSRVSFHGASSMKPGIQWVLNTFQLTSCLWETSRSLISTELWSVQRCQLCPSAALSEAARRSPPGSDWTLRLCSPWLSASSPSLVTEMWLWEVRKQKGSFT